MKASLAGSDAILTGAGWAGDTFRPETALKIGSRRLFVGKHLKQLEGADSRTAHKGNLQKLRSGNCLHHPSQKRSQNAATSGALPGPLCGLWTPLKSCLFPGALLSSISSKLSKRVHHFNRETRPISPYAVTYAFAWGYRGLSARCLVMAVFLREKP